MLDAYTVKKMMPKLLMAIILVNLSWSLCSALIDASNALGSGVDGLMASAFSAGRPDPIANEAIENFGGTDMAIAGVAIGAAVWAFWPVLLTGLAMAAIALFVGYIVILVRQLMLIILVLLSPVALALGVLPGTEQWSKKWWKTFTQLLLMYPLIILFLDSGYALAATLNSQDDQNVLTKILAIIVIFLPYFMIAFVAKFVGGAMSQISGFMNKRGKGMADGVRNRFDGPNSNRGIKRATKEANKKRLKTDGVLGKATKLEGDAKFKGIRNRVRGQRARNLAGYSAVDQALNAASGGRLKQDLPQDISRLQTTIDAKINKEKLQRELDSLHAKIESLDGAAAVQAVRTHFDNAAKNGDQVGMQAAIHSATSMKDVGSLAHMQQTAFMADKNSSTAQAWNKSYAEKSGEWKALAPSLSITRDDVGDMTGYDESTKKATIAQAKSTAFSGASEAALSGMNADGWDDYASVAGANAVKARMQRIEDLGGGSASGVNQKAKDRFGVTPKVP